MALRTGTQEAGTTPQAVLTSTSPLQKTPSNTLTPDRRI